jgi:hypothetical protein
MSTRYILDDDQLTTLTCALEAARDKYLENVRALRLPSGEGPELTAGYNRLAAQFERQAAACSAMIEFLDVAGEEVS